MSSTLKHQEVTTMLRYLSPCVALLLLATASQAQTATPSPYLAVDGQVTTRLSLSQSDFQALPRTTMTVTDGAGKQSIYSGVDLSTLLTKAGVPLKQDLKGTDIAKFLHVQGADGFVAIYSLPEFDHDSFLVADAQDGSPLPDGTGPLQIISPKEGRRSRWVKQLKLLRINKSAPE